MGESRCWQQLSPGSLVRNADVHARRSHKAEFQDPDLAIYTSASTNILHKDHGIANGSIPAKEGISNAPSLGNLSEPSGPAIELEGYGIGM
jgi:hypothetical protein